MTETSEQRIERVARTVQDKMTAAPNCYCFEPDGPCRLPPCNCATEFARAADAISFRAGWDAAIEVLRQPELAISSDEWGIEAADYLAANRPGETP